MYAIRCRGGTGHCAVYYTGPQCFIITFSYSLDQQWFRDWLVQEVEYPNVATNDCILQKEVILCLIFGDVHQVIGHCLIPLDLCSISYVLDFSYKTRFN